MKERPQPPLKVAVPVDHIHVMGASSRVSRMDLALLVLVDGVRTAVFHLCEWGWRWPNVGFSLATLTSLLTSFRFVATLLAFVLTVRLLRMPEGEMRRAGVGCGDVVALPTCATHFKLIGPRNSTSLVVACHGFSGDLTHTLPLARRLAAAGHRVLVYDLVGRGFSSCRNHRHTVDRFVSQLAELVLKLGLADRQAHLVGISLGGAVAAEYSKYYPDRVRSLTLIASVGLPLCTSAHVLTKVPLVPDVLLRCALWSTCLKGLEHEWADECDPKLAVMVESYRDRVKHEPALGRSLLSTLRHFPLENLHDTFRTIGTDHSYPVLLVWGDQDRTCPVRNAACIQAQFVQRARLSIVRGARHCVYTEFCDDVARELVAFLQDK